MSKAKKIIKQLHLWLGLGSGLVVMIVSLTGSLLVFEKELEQKFDPEYYFVENVSGEKQSLDLLMASAQRTFPEGKFNQIFVFTEPERNVFFYMLDPDGKRRVLAVDPYTAKIRKDINFESRFFTVVLQLHRYLLLGKTGKAITGASALAFAVLLISGLILWWPKKRKHLPQRLKVKTDGSFKRFNWDFHAVFGFYSALFLLCIVLTGLTWSYKWYENFLYLIADGKSKPSNVVKSTTVSENHEFLHYEDMLLKMDSIYTFDGDVRFIIPKENDRAIAVYKEDVNAAIPNMRSMAYFDRNNGAVLEAVPYNALSDGEKLRRIVYPIHTGSIYGWPTKVLALIVCLFAGTAPVTGLLIWLGRKKKPLKRA